MAQCGDRRGRGRGGRGRRVNPTGEVRDCSFRNVHRVVSALVQICWFKDRNAFCNLSDKHDSCEWVFLVFRGTFSSSQDRDVRLSKSMSYALRHGANHMGLNMGSGEHPVATRTRHLWILILRGAFIAWKWSLKAVLRHEVMLMLSPVFLRWQQRASVSNNYLISKLFTILFEKCNFHK